MKQLYLKPQTSVFFVKPENIVCTSNDPATSGDTNEKFYDPREWGGFWN